MNEQNPPVHVIPIHEAIIGKKVVFRMGLLDGKEGVVVEANGDLITVELPNGKRKGTFFRHLEVIE